MPTQLRCPWCNAQGLSHIGSYPTHKQVMITYCRICLTIRGVMPLMGAIRAGQKDVQLRCPYCNIARTEQIKIAALGKGWVVVFCQGCGAIHGLTPLVEPRPPALPKREDSLPKQAVDPKTEPGPFADARLMAEIGNADLAAKRAQYEAELTRRAMMARGGATLYRTIALDDGPPHCLTCRRDMEAWIVPPGYRNSGQKIWLCPGGCGAWEAG